MGREGALVESTTFNRRVVGSTPVQPSRKDLGPVHALPAVACALLGETPI